MQTTMHVRKFNKGSEKKTIQNIAEFKF